MLKYILKRIVAAIPVLIIVSVVVFTIIHLTPGDPARAMLGDQALESEVEALREQMGLNQPLLTQYIHWVQRLFRGDMGQSIFIQGKMTEIIMDRMAPTVWLTIGSLLIAVLIAIPCGIFSAKERGRMTDRILMMLSMLGNSIPGFLLGLLLMLLFAVTMKLLPAGGYKDPAKGIVPFLRYIILPCISLGLMHASLITRMTRSSMLEVLNKDYIRMAQAKGVRPAGILFHHALKNAFLPILTVIGQSLVSLLAGAMVTENVFNIPGIGRLVVDSILRRDYEVVQAVILVIAVINILVMLLIDIINSLIDPRLREE